MNDILHCAAAGGLWSVGVGVIFIHVEYIGKCFLLHRSYLNAVKFVFNFEHTVFATFANVFAKA